VEPDFTQVTVRELGDATKALGPSVVVAATVTWRSAPADVLKVKLGVLLPAAEPTQLGRRLTTYVRVNVVALRVGVAGGVTDNPAAVAAELL
jgi:hypothetical protein